MAAQPRADEVLARAPLFAALAPQLRAEVAATTRSVTVKVGEELWRAGDPSEHVGLLASGRLKLARRSGRHEVIVGVAVPGDVLGDVAFTLGEPYTEGVVGLRPSRVLLVPAAALRAALAREPGALAALAHELAGQVRRLEELALSLSAGDVPRRLASVLSSLADRSGEPFPGGVLIPMRLRRADLAALAATTPESVSRQVSAWRACGLLTLQPAGVIVRDLEALRRIAEGATRRASR